MPCYRLTALVTLLCLVGSSAMYAQDETSAAWTFLVFLNADNNLDSAGVDDLSEMQSAGSTGRVNVVVQIDRWHGPAKRFFVRKGAADVVAELGEVDMGDWRQLVEFARWGVAQYPAEHYAVVVWNHGSGWNKHTTDVSGRGISYDDTDGGHITTAELELATAEMAKLIGRKLDVLGFDACLMNMVEVAYQVRRNVRYVVGSEETEPGDGWPYDRVLGKLTGHASMAARDLAGTIVDEYRRSYGLQGTTQSALGAVELDGLRGAMDDFVTACRAAGKDAVQPAVDAALDKVQRFYYKSYIDLFHFVELFADAVDDGGCRAAAERLLKLEHKVVTANGVSGIPFMKMKARGISVYFPTKYGYYSSYDQLAFSADSQWNEFLRWSLGLETEGTTPGDQRLLLLSGD